MANYYELSAEKIAGRVRSMVELRKNYIETGADGLTVRFSTGNRKTGAVVPSVSLIPIADCGNCKVCAGGCYDIRNVCYQKTVQVSRAVNSAIYHSNPAASWRPVLSSWPGFSSFVGACPPLAVADAGGPCILTV